MKATKTIFTVIGTLTVITAVVFACKTKTAENALNGYSSDELNSQKCGEIACADIAPDYKAMIHNRDHTKPSGPDSNAVKIGIFISYDKDQEGAPEGFDDGLGSLPTADGGIQQGECKPSEDLDMGLRSGLKMFSYFTNVCIRSEAELQQFIANQGEKKVDLEAKVSDIANPKAFLPNAGWSVRPPNGSQYVMTVRGRGPALALNTPGITHPEDSSVDENAKGETDPTRLDSHFYEVEIVVDNAGERLGKAFGSHLARPDTAMSFFFGHFYPADAAAANADPDNTREYFQRRTSEIYGPMLQQITADLRSSKKKYLLGFLIGCFSEQLEEKVLEAVNDAGSGTQFDWVGQRGRHNYLEFHTSLHQVLFSMYDNTSTFAKPGKQSGMGILDSFKFGGKSGLESRWASESVGEFLGSSVPKAVIPVLRSNRYDNIRNATAPGKGAAMFDENGDFSRN